MRPRHHGYEVHTVYEACGFGYTLHHALVEAGAHSIVTTPMRLSPERRRKNDRLDARELCVRLSRYREGHRHELKPIRLPSRVEQERRELGRQREFWKRELRRLENHGRAAAWGVGTGLWNGAGSADRNVGAKNCWVSDVDRAGVFFIVRASAFL